MPANEALVAALSGFGGAMLTATVQAVRDSRREKRDDLAQRLGRLEAKLDKIAEDITLLRSHQAGTDGVINGFLEGKFGRRRGEG